MFGCIIYGCYENSKSVYSKSVTYYVNREICCSNYEINSANAYDSFNNNFNNKLSTADVIERDRAVINENLDTKDEHLSIIKHFSENIGYRRSGCKVEF